MSSNEVEQRIMAERRSQPMPPTPGNPLLADTDKGRQYAALDAISELGSDDPIEALRKRCEMPMYTGETMDDFYAHRALSEGLWSSFMDRITPRGGVFGK